MLGSLRSNMEAISAEIFDIKHFAVHDGPGIRTTFFLMGCPLRCLWCQNPESQKNEPIITFTPSKCIGCGECIHHCENLQHSLMLNREDCSTCGTCVSVCHSGAKRFLSKSYTPEDILNIALPEKMFFDRSGGGVTFSGGECLCHPDFMIETLRLLKSNGFHTAVDTCGAVTLSTIESVLPYTDLFLYDIKIIDTAKHLAYTGRENTQILDNLRYLSSRNSNIIIRVPLIPGYTDGVEEISAIGRFISSDLGGRIIRCELLPYNKLAASKYANKTIWLDYSLGKYSLEDCDTQSKEYIKFLSSVLSGMNIPVFSESL